MLSVCPARSSRGQVVVAKSCLTRSIVYIFSLIYVYLYITGVLGPRALGDTQQGDSRTRGLGGAWEPQGGLGGSPGEPGDSF